MDMEILDSYEFNNYYLHHYINPKSAGIFLLISFLGLAAVLLIIFMTAKIQKSRLTKKEGDQPGPPLLGCCGGAVTPRCGRSGLPHRS